MKRTIVIIAVAVVIIAGAVWFRHAGVPQSERVRREIGRVMNGPDETAVKLAKFETLSTDLASAYEGEKRYREAAQIYADKIERARRQAATAGATRPSSSWDVEASCFDHLARLYSAMSSTERAEHARKEAAQARAEADRANSADAKR